MEIDRPAAIAAPPAGPDAEALRRQAAQLEGLLFSEMLRASGTGPPKAFGGRDSPFDGFLRDAQAQAVAGSGQTGLADAIVRALMRRAG